MDRSGTTKAKNSQKSKTAKQSSEEIGKGHQQIFFKRGNSKV